MEIEELHSYDGRNIYSYGPVVKMRVNLGKWEGYSSKDIPYFNEKLICLLPGLLEHHCSRGRPGGFFERLQEGTYLGHIMEHVAIELQGLAGFPVNYGSTRGTAIKGVYEVIFAYQTKEGAITAGNLALELVKGLLEGREFSVAQGIKKIKEVIAKSQLGPSTSAIAQMALKRGIPVIPLGIGSLLQLGYGYRQKRIQATVTGQTSCIGVDLSCDKIATKKLLSEAGIPVPLGGVVKTEEEALVIANNLGGPVVVKPYNGSQGKGVSINLEEEKQVRAGFRIAKNYSEEIIVEQSIIGKDYRLLVVNGKLVAAAQRQPAHIQGDGIHSVKELIEITNQNPLRGEEHEKPLTCIKIDPVALMILAKQNLTLDSVPTDGEIIYLRENGNLSTGGIPLDVLEKVHLFNAQLAIRAARIIGLDVAGIDIVAPDISQPITMGNGAVVEVNAAPGIRMHQPPLANEKLNVAGEIVESLFPRGSKSRIPIVAITGTNGKTTTTRMISHVFNSMGYKVGMTTTDGVYLDGQCVLPGDMTGPLGARTVLQDPSTEVAVLETARGGIVRFGLGYDWSDVGVLTNISEDHLGQDGIEDLEDLIYVKSLVLETVKDKGYVVLNADDPYLSTVVQFIPKKVKIIYFANSQDNLILKKHLEKEQKAVYLKNDWLVLATQQREIPLLAVNDLPASYGGRALYNIQNALATIGALVALEVPLSVITQGLSSFECNDEQNPGRSNLIEIGEVKVLVDYGHNPAGYRAVAQLIKEIKPKKAVGIIGVPGDRQDKLVLEVGQIAANIFQEIIIKEDQNLRGRKTLEVANLLYQGALTAGMEKESIQIIPQEDVALELAIRQANPGDLIVIFYEKLNGVRGVISRLQKELSEQQLKGNDQLQVEIQGEVVQVG